MLAACVIAIATQSTAIAVDEFVFHRRRGLGRWERIGHPLDTLTLAACLIALLWLPRVAVLPIYAAIGVLSILFVTKDEPVHARECTAGEHWLHALLFSLHPLVLVAFGVLWWTGHRSLLGWELALVLGFAGYQAVYWNVLRGRHRVVNNAWYATLGERWYRADDDPVALLRAEAHHRNPWLAAVIARELGPAQRVLDLGCGAGFLANDLAARGHAVVGIDLEPAALAVARDHGTATYLQGDVLALPFADASFDVVCAMDLLEHVETPERLIAEAARVLRPGGLLFFHTFNRTRRANLIVIKGMAWFVANTPPDLHVLRLFVKPEELTGFCARAGLTVVELLGSRPRFRWPLWRMLLTGRVGVEFTFTHSLALGYTGYARHGT